MSAITFTIGFTGSPDASDILGARRIVRIRNDEITAENARRAAQTPPLSALPLLPFATGAELKASYLGILLETVTSAHASYVAQAKAPTEVQSRLSAAEQEQLFAAIATRLNAGDSVATILTDVSS